MITKMALDPKMTDLDMCVKIKILVILGSVD